MKSKRPSPIWDLPTRLFHWTLVMLVTVSWASVQCDALEIHRWSGYAVLIVVGFRLIWGVIGSQHSQFVDFVTSPVRVREYLRGRLPYREGHNPAGGWSVIAMLSLLLLQGFTGLFNSDDMFTGPLAHTVSKDLADALGEWHEINFNLLLALIGLHLGAVWFYQRRRGQDLIKAMLNGGETSDPALRTAPLWLAVLVLFICAGLLWLLLSLAPPPVPFL